MDNTFYRHLNKGLMMALLLVAPFAASSQIKGNNGAAIIPAGLAWAKNSVNTVIFRRNSLVTFKDTQYIAYYDEAQNVVLGKRRLDSKDWYLKTTPYKGDATDAHKSISIMIDGDGYLHMTWGLHGEKLNYCKSVSPGSLELTPKMSMTGFKEKHVTYPEFYKLANGNLLFLYRDGASGNGSLMLDSYSIQTREWKTLQDGWINGEGQRSPYWQTVIDNAGTIQISWVWRETGDVATNHDICYAKSDDGGITWKKSTNEKYVLPITAANAEYSLKIPQKSELINTTAIAVDEKNNPYIVNYWKTAKDSVPQYRLVYKKDDVWQTQQISNRKIPFSLSGGGTKRIPISRPLLIVAQKHQKKHVYVFFRDLERGDKVSVAINKNIDKDKWKFKDLTKTSVGLWEPTYDTELWKDKRILNLFVEHVEQGDGETIKELTGQKAAVLEWGIK
ncbi:BNR repeat-containing protein [Pedobacter sp. SD-b]|uniref:BNR repeat-containing protein n=1 Tax=Pedobacter segetis TaxID=2793069 RepID=A0ABS1BJ34_9SPHI|nr:BNR repeat-containing protein [Pedobacter segetis]MBK0382893.1 BNR repeat-containing protein [Pedobacter segetis]